MTQADLVETDAAIRIENIGGITQTEAELPVGVSVLKGRNATNRTSFLRGLMAALGSNKVSLKGDADEGQVTLSFNGHTYTRTLYRTEDGVTFSGDPYLEDSTVADLFAFLLASNPARQAVSQQDGLRDLIMQPVDMDEINAEIDRLERERNQIDEQLTELESLKKELPELEKRRKSLETDIENKRDNLAAKETEIEQFDTELDDTREQKNRLEERLGELRSLRSDLESVRSEIELQKESIASLREQRTELTQELNSLPDTPTGDVRDIEQELEQLRERKRRRETEMSDLQDLIQFNEEILEGGLDTVADRLTHTQQPDGSPTDQLVDGDEIVCWTCGSDVERERIDDTIDKLRTMRQEYLNEIQDVEAEIEALREQKQKLESQQQRRQTLQQKLTATKEELDNRQEALADARETREQLNEEIEVVEKEIKELESDDFPEILDLHKEANQLEFELERLESDLDDTTDRIAEIEDRLAEEERFAAQREDLTEALEEQRTRIDRIESDVIDAFNTHMEEVLDLLAYDNISRIWIERVEKTVREGRRMTEQTVFDLHIVRTTDAGVTYEDTVEHLSESEQEVTGLIFALAGFLVHEVYEEVPFMLVDSLEAIDADRLSILIEYLADYADYVIVALLPEDAQSVSSDHTRITDL